MSVSLFIACGAVTLFLNVLDSEEEDDIDADVHRVKRMKKVKPELKTDSDSEMVSPGMSQIKKELEPVKVKRLYVRKSEKDANRKAEEGESVKNIQSKNEDVKGKPDKQELANVEMAKAGKSHVHSSGDSDKSGPSQMKDTVGKTDQVITIKMEVEDDNETAAKVKSKRRSTSDESLSSVAALGKAKIEYYLNDGKKNVDEPQEQKEEKKRFKTFEEAFMYSISENLGPRNAAKRHYDQFNWSTRTPRSETKSAKITQKRDSSSEPEGKKTKDGEMVETEKVDVSKVKNEPSGDGEKDITEDIEVLKHQTDIFLEKYKKDKHADVKAEPVTDSVTESLGIGSVAEPGSKEYVGKKNLAAKIVSGQKDVVCKEGQGKKRAENDVPRDLVEKHKDLGQELIQLTHDIIQQQSTKSHKYLDHTNMGPASLSSDKTVQLCNASSEHAKFAKPVFGQPVVGQIMRPLSGSQGQLLVKEFGNVSGAAGSCLDFSQLAIQAKQIEKMKEKSDMNLMCTIQKLSSALQGPPPADGQKAVQPLGGSQGSHDTANGSETKKKVARQPAILRTSSKSVGPQIAPGTVPNPGLISPVLVTAARPPKSPKARVISPKQAQPLSPQATSSYPVISRIQSPTHFQKQIPNTCSSVLNVKSPIVISNTSLLSPAISASPVSVSTSQAVQNTQNALFSQQQSSGTVQRTVGFVNQSLVPGQIIKPPRVHMISHAQRLTPVVSPGSPSVVQTLGQVLSTGHVLACAQSQVSVPGIQPQAQLASPATVVVAPQTVPQFPGRIVSQTPAEYCVTCPQLVSDGSQNLVQVAVPVSGTSQGIGVEGVQSQNGTNVNQTFLVNIPVMRPTISTNTGSGQQMSTGNPVTVVSSQEKQNQVGQIVLPQGVMALKTAPVSSANGTSMGALAPITVETSGLGQDNIREASGKKSERQTVSQLLSAAKKEKMTCVKTNKVQNASFCSGNSGQVNGSASILEHSYTEIKQEPSVTAAQTDLNLERMSDSSASENEPGSKFSPFITNDKCDVNLPQKCLSESPPPVLSSPNKTLQLVPQPIVPISQTFSSVTTPDSASSLPSQLLEGEDSQDIKPPILEMEAPMLELEAPILKLESDQDTVSIKSEPDTLSNYSVGSSSCSQVGPSKHDMDSLPVYPMSSNGLETAQTIIQTASYNSFIGNGNEMNKQSSKKRRQKSGPDGRKKAVSVNREFHSDGEDVPTPKKVRTLMTGIFIVKNM